MVNVIYCRTLDFHNVQLFSVQPGRRRVLFTSSALGIQFVLTVLAEKLLTRLNVCL